MNLIYKISLASLLLISPSLLAKEQTDKNTYSADGKEYVKTNKSDELSGDRPDRGWWFGFDPKESEEEKKKEKSMEEPKKPLMSEKEEEAIAKEKDLGNLLKAMLVEMKKQTRLQEQVLEKLEYAYPKTVPTYTINKKTGERCKSNSSKDCFVMPVIAEGQQVPVLMNMLRTPNKQTAEEYLKWQATYFNHVTDVAYSMKYAYADKGKEAYPTDTVVSRTSTVKTTEQNARDVHESLLINNMKDKLGLLVFLDNKILLEENQYVLEYIKTGRGFSKKLQFMFVFKNKEMESYFLNKIAFYNKEGYDSMVHNLNFKTTVNPEAFKKKNVQITPTTFMVYKDNETKKNVEQLINTGHVSTSELRRDIIDALVYYKVIEPKDLSIQDHWDSLEKAQNIIEESKKEDRIYQIKKEKEYKKQEEIRKNNHKKMIQEKRAERIKIKKEQKLKEKNELNQIKEINNEK